MYFTDREKIPDGQNTGKPASGQELETCVRNIKVKTVLIMGSVSLQQGDIHDCEVIQSNYDLNLYGECRMDLILSYDTSPPDSTE